MSNFTVQKLWNYWYYFEFCKKASLFYVFYLSLHPLLSDYSQTKPTPFSSSLHTISFDGNVSCTNIALLSNQINDCGYSQKFIDCTSRLVFKELWAFLWCLTFNSLILCSWLLFWVIVAAKDFLHCFAMSSDLFWVEVEEVRGCQSHVAKMEHYQILASSWL